MSEVKVPKIYGAICDIMSEVGSIGKNKKTTSGQIYNFRGIDDVVNALQPIMIKYRVFATPEVLEDKREERATRSGGNLIYTVLKVKYTFYADDGSSVNAIVVGEGMDSGDKSANKAMSVAYKYACFQVFSIPTEEMIDPDASTPPSSTPVKQQPTQTNSNGITDKSFDYIGREVVKLTPNKDEQKEIYNKCLTKWNITNIRQLQESDVSAFVKDMQTIHRATPVNVAVV